MRENIGLVTQTVRILRRFGAIPVDLIAKELHRSPTEIKTALKVLEEQGLLEQKGDMVSLSERASVEVGPR